MLPFPFLPGQNRLISLPELDRKHLTLHQTTPIFLYPVTRLLFLAECLASPGCLYHGFNLFTCLQRGTTCLSNLFIGFPTCEIGGSRFRVNVGNKLSIECRYLLLNPSTRPVFVLSQRGTDLFIRIPKNNLSIWAFVPNPVPNSRSYFPVPNSCTKLLFRPWLPEFQLVNLHYDDKREKE